MQRRTYTQNDLKEVLKKLVDERHKVKTLEQEVASFQETPQEELFPPQEKSSSKEEPREILILKEVIKKLGEKVKSQEIALQKEFPSNSQTYIDEIHALKKSIQEQQKQTKSAFVKHQELEESLSCSEKTRQILMEQLKEQNAKIVEFEKLKDDYTKATGRIFELEKSISLLKAESYSGEDPAFQEQIESLLRQQKELEQECSSLKTELACTSASKESIQERADSSLLRKQLENQVQEMKARYSQALSKTKELEGKVDSLSSENAYSQFRLRDLTKKTEAQERELQKLQTELERASKERDTLKKELGAKEVTIQEVNQKLQEMHSLQEKVEELTKEHALLVETKNQAIETLEQKISEEVHEKEELEAQCTALKETVREKEEGIEQERLKIKAIDQELFEVKEQVEQVEQHLARRVKECTLLSSQIEEHTESLVKASGQNERLRNVIGDLEKSLLLAHDDLKKEQEAAKQKTQEAEQEKETWKAKYETLFVSWEDQGKEIRRLRSIQERFSQLEHLFSQCEDVLLSASTEATPQEYEMRKPQPARKEPEIVKKISFDDSLFSKNDVHMKPKRNDLFE